MKLRLFAKSTILIAACLAAGICRAQYAPGSSPADLEMANHLLACASAHSDNIQLLQEQKGRDVSKLYPVMGYFKVGGQAYSSAKYAEHKYSELREGSRKRLEAALSAPAPESQNRFKAFGDDLKKTLLECADFQRKNADVITARIKTSGVLGTSAP